MVSAAVPHEQDPALQKNDANRQQLLAGWGLREVLLMHKDVNNNELQNVSQGPV